MAQTSVVISGADEGPDCWSDISAVREALGYEPAIGFEEGLRRTIEWIESEVML